MSKRPDAWMPLYIGDYLGDTTRFTALQHGAYLLLIMDYWRNGPLVDNSATLSMTAKCTPAQWRRICYEITQKFEQKNGRLHHKRIDAEMAKAEASYERAKQKAVIAAETRWRAKKADAPSNAPSNAPGNQQAMLEQCQSQSQSQSTKSKDVSLRDMSESPAATSDVIALVPQEKPSRLRQEAGDLLAFLNAKTGRHFRPTGTTLKPIMARLKEGFTVQECKAVIARKVRAWKGDDHMAPYLRPETLFGATKFAQYVGEVPPEVVNGP